MSSSQQNPKTFSGGSKTEGKIGSSAEDVDWSKISKDTKTTSGGTSSDDNPSRIAERTMAAKAASKGGDNTGDTENIFESLKEEST